jgi:hypothetical protein
MLTRSSVLERTKHIERRYSISVETGGTGPHLRTNALRAAASVNPPAPPYRPQSRAPAWSNAFAIALAVQRMSSVASIARLPATTRSPVTLASHGVHQLDHHVDREPVRQRDRVGAAVAA